MQNQQHPEHPDAAVLAAPAPEASHPRAEELSDLSPVAQAVAQSAPVQRLAIVVFWLEDGLPMCETLGEKQLSESLKLCEALRKRRAAGERISHVCTSPEYEDSVGLPGVSDKLPEGYDWTKQGRAGSARRR